MSTKSPRKPAKSVPFESAMRATGFSKPAVDQMSEFWAGMGISSIKVGKTVLKVNQPKQPKKTKK